MISGPVTGCLYAITARVSSAGRDSFSGGFRLLTKVADGVVMLRLGGHLVAAGDFADGQPVLGLIEFGNQLVQQNLEPAPGVAAIAAAICARVSGSSAT